MSRILSEFRLILASVRWIRVFFYASIISITTLNIIGGTLVKRAMLPPTEVSLSPFDDLVKPPQSELSVMHPNAQSADTGHHKAIPKTSTSKLEDEGAYSTSRIKNFKKPELMVPRISVPRIHTVKSIAPFNCSAGMDPVHVVYASDPKEYVAMLASLTSALHHSYHPHRLRFHLIYPAQKDPAALCRLVRKAIEKFPSMKCDASLTEGSVAGGWAGAEGGEVEECGSQGPQTGGGRDAATRPCHCASHQFQLVPFNDQEYSMLRLTTSGSLDRKELLTGVNFARNFMDDLLLPQGVERAIYLDVDTIVQGDLVWLWETKFKEGKLFGAANSCYLHMSYW